MAKKSYIITFSFILLLTSTAIAMEEDFGDFPDANNIKSNSCNNKRKETSFKIEYPEELKFGCDKENGRYGYIKESLLKLDEESTKKRIKKDRRNTVHDVKDYPYSSILSLEMRISDRGYYLGSAAVVWKNIILTAAHNVIDIKTNNIAKNIRLHFCRSGAQCEETLPVHGYVYHKEYEKNSDPHDYAVLCLNYNAGKQFGSIAPKPNIYNNEKVFISGYPDLVMRDEKWVEKAGKHHYEHCTEDNNYDGFKVNEKLCDYDIDTTHGQSGSPIRVKKEDLWESIGVHTDGSEKYNSGVYINNEVFENIKKWATYLNKNFKNPPKTDSKVDIEDGFAVFLSDKNK